MIELFYLFAGMIVLSAIGMLWTKKVLYSIFFFLLLLLSIAGLYVLMSADFIAVVQIIIYGAGIITLILFSIMIAQRDKNENTLASGNRNLGLGMLIGTIFFVIIWKVLSLYRFPDQYLPTKSTLHFLGAGFITEYLLAFELIALLLLIAVIGSLLILSKK